MRLVEMMYCHTAVDISGHDIREVRVYDSRLYRNIAIK